LRIDSEFKNLIPPLTEEEYKGLENSILSEGCRDNLVTWNDILIDGHNRYEICQKHNIEFTTINTPFFLVNGEEIAAFKINDFVYTCPLKRHIFTKLDFFYSRKYPVIKIIKHFVFTL